ncbi:MAG: carbon-nitrogen hydrolase family protein [Clostridia bacterium]|nr:carbon-nitrogen hydrolase family protein [Clostridia bacterium]
MKNVTVALIQMMVIDDKEKNLATARSMIKKAAAQGANIVVLPEMFCCPYENKSFIQNKEPRGGRVWNMLSQAAAENKVYLVGGSMPEEDREGRLYNTSFVFGPDGREIAVCRKMHLFDIDVPGGQYFKESDVFSAGDKITVVSTEYGNFGVAICFDIRFPELSRLMALEGASMIIVPGAFNMTTGPAHWELLFRSRALDNQLFTFGCAPAQNTASSYVSYGNSIAVSPWGTVLGRLGFEEGILLQTVDLDEIEKYRSQLPLMKNRRKDLYRIEFIGYY